VILLIAGIYHAPASQQEFNHAALLTRTRAGKPAKTPEGDLDRLHFARQELLIRGFGKASPSSRCGSIAQPVTRLESRPNAILHLN